MPKPTDEQPSEDFATRLGRHIFGEANPDNITEPEKPGDVEKDEKPNSSPNDKPNEKPDDDQKEPVGSGLAIGDLLATAKKKKKTEKKEDEDEKSKGEKDDDDNGEKDDDPPTDKKEDKKKEERRRVTLERRETKPTPEPEKKSETPSKDDSEPEEAKTLDELVGLKLTDDEREYLEVVRYAEGKDKNLKGALERETARLRAFADFAKKWRKEHPGEPIDPKDEDYKALVAEHPPTLSKSDVKRLDREKLRDELKAENEKLLKEERERLDAKLREVEVAPRVEKQVQADEEAFGSYLGDDDFKGVLDKKGIEGRIARAHKQSAIEHVKAYRRIAEGLDRLDKDNPVHTNIVRLMDAAGDYFKKHGGPNGLADLAREGRKFVSRREYAQLAASNSPELDRVWTFDHTEMVSIIMGNHAGNLKKEIEDLRKDMEEDGYLPGKPKPNGSGKASEDDDDDDEDDDDDPSPRSGPSPSSGGASNGKGKKPTLSRFERHLVGDPNGD